MALKIIGPPFTIDLGTVSIESGDFDLAEAGRIVGLSRVSRAICNLYQQTGSPPAVVYASDIGHLKSLAATLRIAQIRAIDLNDWADTALCRSVVAELGRTLDVVVSGKRLIGSTAIPKLTTVILARPTLSSAVHAGCLARLDRSRADLTVIDMIGGCQRHGTWPGAGETEVIVGAAVEVVADPVLEQICDMPHKDALRWCGNNIARIEILQKAKNRKDGWSFHVIEATRGKVEAERWWNSRKSS